MEHALKMHDLVSSVRRLIVLFGTGIFVFASVGVAYSRDVPVTADGLNVNVSVTSAEALHSAILHIPANYNPADIGRYPLMLSFHGLGGTGAGQEKKSGFDAIADANGFFVAYPNSSGDKWRPLGENNDLIFTMKLIHTLEAQYSIDPARIYAAGLSEGGGFTQQLACMFPDMLAGIAVVANNMNDGTAARCVSKKPIAVLIFHGTDDPVSPYQGGDNYRGKPIWSTADTAKFWATSNGCSAQPQIIHLPPIPGDPAPTIKTTYEGCGDGTKVILYTIEGGGHTWPGSEPAGNKALGLTSMLDASKIIWESLRAFHKVL
jgi:polyhydroxybutyrate depolymerase